VKRTHRRFLLYGAVVGLFALVLGWWLFFFSRLGTVLAERVARTGVELSPHQIEALRDAAGSTVRMLLFEGTFLVLLLILGVLLIVRTLQSEVALHRQRQNFLSAVTHELKTPIASARLHVESLQLGRVPETKRQRYLETTRAELDRLAAMVEHLLQTARARARPQDITFEEVDLAQFVRERAPVLAQETPALTVEVEAEGSLPVKANPEALETILRNLLGNAEKYGGSPARARVRVHEGERSTGACLEVRDWGPGLGETSARKLFEPFQRGGDELVRERPGIGLGLYLVSELVRAHGGKVRAGNANGSPGFSVEVQLPRAAARGGER
jgi:signal transduction histidine kinase